MEEHEAIFKVQGSDPEPYVIIVRWDPLTISCTCTASLWGDPCKHRRQILMGNCENIIAGPDDSEKVLELIKDIASKSDIFTTLSKYDSVKNSKKKADNDCNKVFKEYRNELLRLALHQVKTDKNTKKAFDKMKIASDKWLELAIEKENMLDELRVVFIIPQYIPQ